MQGIGEIEFNLMQVLRADFDFTRDIFYANERIPQSTTPYIIMNYLSMVKVGRPYSDYEEDDLDLDMKQITPVEIAFTFIFIGGNARGDLSLFLQEFWGDSQKEALAQKGLAFLTEAGIIDISTALGGDMEQRASSDVTFSANIISSETLVKTIREVVVDLELQDLERQTIYEKQINV